jgi:hypothetical protein
VLQGQDAVVKLGGRGLPGTLPVAAVLCQRLGGLLSDWTPGRGTWHVWHGTCMNMNKSMNIRLLKSSNRPSYIPAAAAVCHWKGFKQGGP